MFAICSQAFLRGKMKASKYEFLFQKIAINHLCYMSYVFQHLFTWKQYNHHDGPPQSNRFVFVMLWVEHARLAIKMDKTHLR